MNQTPKGRIRWAVTALAVACCAALPATAGASSARSQVIVQLDAGSSAAAVKAQVREYGGQVTRDLPIINGFAAKLSDGAAASLQRVDGVREVTKNTAIKPQAVNVSELQTAYPSSSTPIEAWNKPDANVTGKNVGVAVIDTGIAGQMKDFEEKGPSKASRVVASVVTNPYATSAKDTYGHGTHVAGIIAGNGTERTNGDLLQNKYIGVAPEADLVSVKVSDDLGNATVLDVIYGLQWVVDFKSQYNIRVVNLSLEATTPAPTRPIRSTRPSSPPG
jgi:serine protease AprX